MHEQIMKDAEERACFVHDPCGTYCQKKRKSSDVNVFDWLNSSHMEN